jgi:hypothetical protein
MDHHNFVNYIDFELSENEETSLFFPEINVDNIREITVSHMWRVVIYQGFMENLEQQLVFFFFKLVTLIDLLLPCSVKQDNTCLTENIKNVLHQLYS